MGHMDKFRRMPLQWKIMLGVQAVLTLGILGHRIVYLQEAQQKQKQKQLEELEIEAYKGIKARDSAPKP
jgi:hypothetical protein